MSWSTYLKELPDLSNAKSLEEVYLDRCTSLATFPSSIQNLHKLRELDLEGCTELESFPILINLKSLEYLNLRECSRLRNFPQIYINSSHGFSLEVEGCFWNNCLCGLDYLGCIMRCIPCKFRPATCLRSYGKASRYVVSVIACAYWFASQGSHLIIPMHGTRQQCVWYDLVRLCFFSVSVSWKSRNDGCVNL